MSFTLPRELSDKVKALSRNEKTSISEIIEKSIQRATTGTEDLAITLGNFAKLRKDLAPLAEKYQIEALSLFGSVLHQTAGPNSDIDLLVEFKPNHRHGLFDLVTLESALSTLFANRKVDLRTPNDLSKYFRERVMREAVVLYDS